MRPTFSYLATVVLLFAPLPSCGSDSNGGSGSDTGGQGGNGGGGGGASAMGGAGTMGGAGGAGTTGGAGGAGTTGGAGGASTTGGSGGGGGSGGADQFDVVCDTVATALCEARQPCCESGPGFDMTTCVAREVESCAADAARVRTGEFTFDEAAVNPCLAQVGDVFGDCNASTLQLLTEHQSFFAECTGIFSGSVPIGGACTTDSECDRTNATGLVSCDAGLCAEIALAAEGEACAFGGGGALCEYGQYCDTDFSAPGTCKPATPLGQSCDTNVAVNLECGLLNYCEASTGQCAAGKADGAPCASDLECESLSCPSDTCVGSADTIVTAKGCGI